MDKVWLEALWQTLELGHETSPRGKKVKELLCYQTTIPMARPIVTVAERQLGYRFAAAEPAWILSGDNKLSTIAPFAKHFRQFSDDGLFLSGAYGVKILEQLGYVARTLDQDPSSRQAVLNIWRERPEPSVDVPCTLSLQWVIRDGKLHCLDSMRSSDLWLGLPYDWISMSCVSVGLLIILKNVYGRTDLKLGNLTVTAGSSHLYEHDWEKAREVISNPTTSYSPDVEKISSIYSSFEEFTRLLWVLARGDGLLKGLIQMEDQLS